VELSRYAFAESIRRLGEREFPEDSLESLSASPDLEHSLSANFVRGVLRRAREVWAWFVVPDSQEAQDAARCLTFALLWLDRLQQTANRRAIARMRMVPPSGTAAPLAHLLATLPSEVANSSS